MSALLISGGELRWLKVLLPQLVGVPSMRFFLAPPNGPPPDFAPEVCVLAGETPPCVPIGAATMAIWVQTTPHQPPLPLGVGIDFDLCILMEDETNEKNRGAKGVLVLRGDDRFLLERFGALVTAKSDQWPSILSGAPWPIVSQEDTHRRLMALQRNIADRVPKLREIYLQCKKRQDDRLCIATAKALDSIGKREPARALLSRVLSPLFAPKHRIDPQPNCDEKMANVDGAEVGFAREATSEEFSALSELVSSWSRDEEDSDCDDSIRRLSARQLHLLVKRLQPCHNADPRWLSVLLACHRPSTPFATDNNNSNNNKGIGQILVVEPKGGASGSNFRRQLAQLADIGRYHLPDAISKETVEEAIHQAAVADSWSLVINTSQNMGLVGIGPMFLRDFDALKWILNKLDVGGWDAVRIGFELPAIETITSLADSSPKRLLAMTATLFGEFCAEALAFCVSPAAAAKRLHQSKAPMSIKALSFSAPTIFASPI